MESRLLSSLGKVAGLGGIALGVFLLLFRGVLEKDFLPKAGLEPAQAYAIILSLMIFTFGIAGLGLIAWLISRATNPKAPIPASTLSVLVAVMAVVIGAAVFVGASPKKIIAGDCGIAVGGNISGSNVGTDCKK